MIGFCSSPRFVEHDTGPHHPERPDRIRAVYAAVCRAGLIDSPDPWRIPEDFGPLEPAAFKLLELEPAPAEVRWLAAVHTPRLIEHVKHVCQIGGGVLDQGDTPVGPASFDVALLAVGAVLGCCDAVMSGQVSRAFAAVRPPGHHAEPDASMGFCLFSNVAIAARYLQQRHGIGRVAVVDFDVHHGNGTQAALEDDSSILFVSLHQNPRTCYPGSGYEWETGVGTTMNIPLDPGCGDEQYLAVFRERVIPALDAFAPQFLLISAGFDAHREDPLAHMQVSEDGFFQMTRLLVNAAQRHCGGRIVSALEGGYNLRALGRSVVQHLLAMDDRQGGP